MFYIINKGEGDDPSEDAKGDFEGDAPREDRNGAGQANLDDPGKDERDGLEGQRAGAGPATLATGNANILRHFAVFAPSQRKASYR